MFEEEIKNHNAAIREQIFKGFQEYEEIEKARVVGDLFQASDGKMYVWKEYMPGKFGWRIYQKNHIVKGKGIGGKHGTAMLKSVFSGLDKNYTDVNRMMLKRTPSGNWRLYYDDKDAGFAINGDAITVSELKGEGVTYQSNMVVDNFDLVKDYMEFDKPDDVYFVQIIKRWKDNQDKPGAEQWRQDGRQAGTYHSGAEFLSYYLVHSYQELQALKPQIIRECQYNNARAYMSINTRDEKQTSAYLQKYVSKFSPNDPRAQHAEAILYGQAKTGKEWRDERFKVLVDIDTTKDSKVTLPNGKSVNVWDETIKRLKDLNIKVALQYETPSGGLHLILNNKNNRNLRDFYAHLNEFDGGRDLGRNAMVHPSEDVKLVLYSNVETAGY